MATAVNNGWKGSRWWLDLEHIEDQHHTLVQHFNEFPRFKVSHAQTTAENYSIFYEKAEAIIVDILSYFDVDVDKFYQSRSPSGTHQYHQAVLDALKSGTANGLYSFIGAGEIFKFLIDLEKLRNQWENNKRYTFKDTGYLESLGFDVWGDEILFRLEIILDCMKDDASGRRAQDTTWQHVRARDLELATLERWAAKSVDRQKKWSNLPGLSAEKRAEFLTKAEDFQAASVDFMRKREDLRGWAMEKDPDYESLPVNSQDTQHLEALKEENQTLKLSLAVRQAQIKQLKDTLTEVLGKTQEMSDLRSKIEEVLQIP